MLDWFNPAANVSRADRKRFDRFLNFVESSQLGAWQDQVAVCHSADCDIFEKS